MQNNLLPILSIDYKDPYEISFGSFDKYEDELDKLVEQNLWQICTSVRSSYSLFSSEIKRQKTVYPKKGSRRILDFFVKSEFGSVIVEDKIFDDFSAISQLLMYKALLKEENPNLIGVFGKYNPLLVEIVSENSLPISLVFTDGKSFITRNHDINS